VDVTIVKSLRPSYTGLCPQTDGAPHPRVFVEVMNRNDCQRESLTAFPRQSLRRGGQKSFPSQGSGFQKSKAQISALFIEFTPSNTLVWSAAAPRSYRTWIPRLQGYLAHKKAPPPMTLQ